MAGNLINAVKGVVTNAINAAKSVLGIHSPSTVFHGFGVNTILGFVQGIDKTGGKAQTALDKVFNGLDVPDLQLGVGVDTAGVRAATAAMNISAVNDVAPVVVLPDTITVRDAHGFEVRMQTIASETVQTSNDHRAVLLTAGAFA
jgi:hypothetical protein